MSHDPEIQTDNDTGRKFTKYKGFACQCGDEAKQRMADLHAFIQDTFYAPYKAEIKQEIRVTQYLYILAGNYQAWVDSIPLDPGGWGALVVEGGPKNDGLDCYVQWDYFEDGLAEVIKAFHDKYGNTSPHSEEDDEADDGPGIPANDQ